MGYANSSQCFDAKLQDDCYDLANLVTDAVAKR